MPHQFSIIIPIYNRPDELDELLQCIESQSYKQFEVIVIEDGSKLRCDKIVEKYQTKFEIKYFYQENTGQGFARNFGLQKGIGDYFIILDSDALLEPDYLEIVAREIEIQKLDLFGGPDKDHPSFTPIQKAISYTMTSVFTTGGIRGSKKNLGGTFHPRSFNMGFSRKLYETIGGFKITRMGEDIEFSIRAIGAGFKSGLIPEAFIYHKRRTSFSQFYKQLFFFGRARINIARFFPKELKLVHFFPALFTLGCISILFLPFISMKLFWLAALLFGLYKIMIFVDAYRNTKSIKVAYLSVVAAFIQLTAYGLGFIKEGLSEILMGKKRI
jgi:glycosyltransferase involved in cell wall biosynthesis